MENIQIDSLIITIIKSYEDAILSLDKVGSIQQLDVFRSLYLGKKSPLSQVMQHLGKLPPEEKPLLGQKVNEVKSALESDIEKKKKKLKEAAIQEELDANPIDVTLPGIGLQKGHVHPLTKTQSELLASLSRLGFTPKEGPDIESEFYNFEALNIPEDHPARDMHDTFYLNSGFLLRTHTSPVQIRVMQAQKPPLKIAVSGKVYRCDSDATHSPCFHQIEGLYVSETASMSELKGVLSAFISDFLGGQREIRFRPSYFPFTEPSVEVDVACFKCEGKGCNLCKQTGWIEVLGAGMVQRNVFRSVGYDPDKVRGFAFGIGVDRMCMLKYGISDIRLLYENDLRFLRQFS